ncbi:MULTISPECIES: hypothetical protein [Microbacterium]|uniref:hypothetical protein n=1 Tax=Microbacterium TaxID=33882 RepID=UPI0007341100|nr:hypothetical protein [Microbacterium testaceum]KTS83595.1 hypothetical protein NS183_15420 [Microbacterium testaceum]
MNRRLAWRILGWVAPAAALLVVLAVLRGAGVPLTFPGVVLTLLLLVLVRVVVVRARRRADRRRTDRR